MISLNSQLTHTQSGNVEASSRFSKWETVWRIFSLKKIARKFSVKVKVYLDFDGKLESAKEIFKFGGQT